MTRFSQDQKIRLYKWDGKAFQEEGLLQSNQGLVSALAFSPDGSKLAAGDVSALFLPPSTSPHISTLVLLR
jgi:WD40 repeat protein